MPGVFPVQTRQRHEVVGIPDEVRGGVKRGGVQDGFTQVSCPHTMAATINDACAPDEVHEMRLWLVRTGPHRQESFGTARATATRTSRPA